VWSTRGQEVVHTPLVELGRAWSGNSGDRVDRVDLIGSGNPALWIYQFSIDNDIRMIYFINTLCCLFTYCFIWFVSETRRFSVDNEIEASVPRTTFNDTLLSPVLPKPTSPYSRVSVPQTRTENVTGYNQNVRGCGSQRRHVVVNQRKLILIAWS